MPTSESQIASPDDQQLKRFCNKLSGLTEKSDNHHWPAAQIEACADAGIFRWFVPEELGGTQWSTPDLVRGYLALSSACLTTTFVITQRTAACRRIAGCDNVDLKEKLLPALASGEIFSTVGISHLTTSRRHVAKPVLRATEIDGGIQGGGFRVDGFSPWVTGGAAADVIVAGATLDDGREILFAVDTTDQGLVVLPYHTLVGLTGSCTGRVNFNNVVVNPAAIIGGPVENVLVGNGGGAGGFQTSSLALGLASGAIEYVESQAENREWLGQSGQSLRSQHDSLVDQLIASAEGSPVCSNEELRTAANSIALRATQAALVAAKGAGYVEGHPAGRWCREAMFFLVWSCPTAVSQASLCELAGIE